MWKIIIFKTIISYIKCLFMNNWIKVKMRVFINRCWYICIRNNEVNIKVQCSFFVQGLIFILFCPYLVYAQMHREEIVFMKISLIICLKWFFWKLRKTKCAHQINDMLFICSVMYFYLNIVFINSNEILSTHLMFLINLKKINKLHDFFSILIS